MSYTTTDFSESLRATRFDHTKIKKVGAAWGSGSGQGEDSGPGWSEHGVTEWSGGFVLKLTDGRYAYLTGWCDYTGWGCQDGAEITYYDKKPRLEELNSDAEWDLEPADLNLWLTRGAPDPYA